MSCQPSDIDQEGGRRDAHRRRRPGQAGAQAAEAEHGEGAPAGPVPAEPVVAFVRDAKRGEVTVMAGTRETTYRDPALVARLEKAARRVTKGVR